MPGVPGIGVKTAAQLITEYGDLETLLKRAGEIKQDKRRQTLIDNAELARISKRLVTLDQNVKLEVPVEDLAVHEPDYKHLVAFLKAMEFSTLTRRVAEKSGIEANEIEADAKLRVVRQASAASAPPANRRKLACPYGKRRPVRAAAAAAQQGRARRRPLAGRAGRSASRRRQGQQDRPQQIRNRPHARPAESLDAARQGHRRRRGRHQDHQRRPDDGAAVRLLARGRRQRSLLRADRSSRGRASRSGSDLFAPEAKLCADQIAEKAALAALRPVLEDPSVLKVGQNLKFDWQIFARRGIEIFPTTTPC